MTLLESVKTCLTTKYADFKGRASRSEFWWFILSSCVVMFAMAFLYLGLTKMKTNADTIGSIFFAILLILTMALMIPILSVIVRRLHDVGRSGWFFFVSLIPWIGNIILFVFLLLPSKVDETVAEDVVEQETVAEEAVVEEKSNNLSIYTLPLTLSLAMMYGPFCVWMMHAPYGMIIGEGVVGAILLIVGAYFIIWKKLCWPKDKWLWIATILIVVLLLSNITCRIVGYNNIYLPLSVIFFYPLWTVYFGIRFWQANKK